MLLLESLYYDVCEKFNIKSLGGASCFFAFIDDAHRKVWEYPMKSKGKVFDIPPKFHVSIERETKKLLKCLRKDNGGEYCSNSFKDYCNRFKIKHENTLYGTTQ